MRIITFLLFLIVWFYSCDNNPTTIDSNNPINVNNPPSRSQAVYPTNGQQNIPDSILLRWECIDQDGDSLTYTILLDTISPPSSILVQKVYQDSFAVTALTSGMTYYWRIWAFDGEDSTASQVFSFSMKSKESNDSIPVPSNTPPSRSQAVYPTNGQQNIPDSILLRWECIDQDGDSLTYTILFDTISPPSSILVQKVNQDSFAPKALTAGMTYYWRIWAFDGEDSTASQVFSFSRKSIEWDDLIPDLKKQCYIIGIEADNKILGKGSGFAISSTQIMTNAHVVYGLIEIAEKYRPDSYKFIAVRDGGTLDSDYSYELDKFAIHPGYDSTTNYTFDFAIVTIKKGTLTDTCIFETNSNLHSLMVGCQIATIGFPGETRYVNRVNPIATYKNGTISAVRPFAPNKTPSNNLTNVVIQHNFNTTGGTSGSPVFNKQGKVIAIHNSGSYMRLIKNSKGLWVSVPVGSLGYSIRIDQRAGLETQPLTAFNSIKPKKVYYHFINGTFTPLQFNSPGFRLDTIESFDTLELWDYKGEPVDDIIRLRSIVATDNYLSWKDTLRTGVDFTRRYIASDKNFLYRLCNKTNKNVKSCVVSNSLKYDSTSLYLPIGKCSFVGYYKASSATDFRLYLDSTSQIISWEGIDTRSSTGKAKLMWFKATLEPESSTKRTATNDIKKKRQKKVIYYRGDLLENPKH